MDKNIPYHCEDDAHEDSTYCVFHDKEYLNKDTKDEIEKLFLDKLHDSIKANKPLLCIGYILPSLSIPHDIDSINIPMCFDRAVFEMETSNISNITFNKKISFWLTTFKHGINFNKIKFKMETNFRISKFKNKSTFKKVYSDKLMDFTNSKFNEIEFIDGKFNEIEFLNCKFYSIVKFMNIQFIMDARFKIVQFYDMGIFSESSFLSKINFDKSVFSKLMRFSKVKFTDAYFNSDLSYVSFSDTDIKMINFGTNTLWNSNDYKIYDEIQLENNNISDLENEFNVKPNNLESVKNVYRDLRDNYDRNLQYDISGQFFNREMELNRKYKDHRNGNEIKIIKKPLCSRTFSIYRVYGIIAKYGHSYVRPLIFEMLIIICAILYFLYDCHNNAQCLNPISYSINNAFLTIMPFGTLDKQMDTIPIILKSLFLIFSGILFISLKRKLERKLRY